MNVSTGQLRQHLIDKGIQSIYFVYGDEALQVRDNTQMLRNAAKHYGFEEREVFNADKSFDWQELEQSANEISLFSSKKLIELYLPTGKPGDKGSKAIVNYCQNIQEDNILLIYSGELESASKRSKWFKQLQSSGVIVAVYPLKDQQLKAWLSERMYKEGLQCESECIDFLSELIEGNLLAADQEIIKLALLYKDIACLKDNKTLTRISMDNIKDSIQSNTKYKAFDLFDTVLRGQSKQVLSMLDNFQQEGVAIVWLLFIIAKELRLMAKINAYQQEMQLPQAMRKEYVFAQRKALVEQVLAKNKFFKWDNYMLELAEIDKQIKGISLGNPWINLNRLLLNLSKQLQ